ncbi:MAG: HAMP domain-containing protein [Planctomycetes bacterium]|nr:HAMP domain-containing protein [Planctomycetota bacterium]
MNFRKRVILAIVLCQVLMAGVLNLVIWIEQARAWRRLEERSAATAANCVSHGCVVAVESGDRGYLDRFVVEASAQHGPDCRYVVVESATGEILAATDPVPPDEADLAIAAPIVSAGNKRIGTLRMRFSGDSIRASQRQALRTSTGVTGAALVAGFLLAFLVDRRLTRSLRSLIAATEAMSSGDLARRVSIRTGDELQWLGDRFNDMADRLAETIASLRRHEEELETRILERTADLERERQKLSGIVQSMGAGLLVIDRRSRVVWANHLVREWFAELAPAGDARSVRCPFGGGDRCLVRAECPAGATFRDGKTHRSGFHVGDGERRRDFLVSATPIRRKSGQVEQVVELVQEITGEKRMEQDLIHAGKLAAVGELAAGIAHQLNNPLAVIRAHVERLVEVAAKGDSPGAIARHSEVVQKHIARCCETIDSLLRFSRRGSGETRPVRLGHVLDEAVALLRQSGSHRHTAVEIRIPDSIPWMECDPEGLLQVFVNVLVNAADAAGPTGRVEVWGEMGARGVAITIADDGPGVPAELQTSIFRPFFTTKPAGKGTGLGLAICCRILEGMGGKISLVDGPMPGAHFRIDLPLAEREVGIVG